MKLCRNVGLATVALSLAIQLFAGQEYAFQPENPVTSEWLTQHLRPQSPKLMLTPARLKKLKSAIAVDDTTADAMVSGNSIKLSQNGKSLQLLVEKPANPVIRIVPLNPPPLSHDMKIEGLKRIEIIQSGDVMEGECVEYNITLNNS